MENRVFKKISAPHEEENMAALSIGGGAPVPPVLVSNLIGLAQAAALDGSGGTLHNGRSGTSAIGDTQPTETEEVRKARFERLLNERYDTLQARIRSYYPNMDEARLREAFDFACMAHAGQPRKDGSPYVTHPVEVAHIVADLALDEDSIIAALLHDTVEDTGYEFDDIKKKFGQAVAELVDGVTKLTRIPYASREDQQMENLRKMFLAMSRDIRVILIKIADRLHNMRTLEFHKEAKRREKARETMEIYAPLAHRLGISKVKWELEDLALQNLDPPAYKEIIAELSARNLAHEEFLLQVQERIGDRLSDAGLEAHIEGRVKHAYSIYRKMYNQHKKLFEIYDLYAVRVIVDRLDDCYTVLGLVHDQFRPLPGRFKDYISTPKPNQYQSLHTTVLGREGVPFEVQIRTWDMHHIAEYGIAAHWKYKQGVSGEVDLQEKLGWVRRLLESQQDTDSEEFIHDLRIDLFAGEVFVFTPSAEVINLPAGAGPIDFAYAIHSAVGNRMIGAKVNGRMVNLEYTLQNGDIVEILTGSGHGPSRDWLKIAKTAEARNKIKQWFKKEHRAENVTRGREEFEIELRHSGISEAVLQQSGVMPELLRKMSFSAMDDLYAAIGFGGTTATRAVNRVRDELVRVNKLQSDKDAVEKLMQAVRRPRKDSSGVVVEGLDNCQVKFSRCCMPVPGDGIVGFVTKGYGVSIHRRDCVNVSDNLEDETGRWVAVSWAKADAENYQTQLQIISRNHGNLIADIATALSNLHVPIHSLSAQELGDGYAVCLAVLSVKGREQLEEVSTKLMRVSGVIEVNRKGM